MEPEHFTELNIVLRVGRAANAPFDQAFTACTWLHSRCESALSEQVEDGDNICGSTRIGVLRRPLRTLCGSICVFWFLFFLKALLFIAELVECCTAVFIGVTFNGGVKAGLALPVSDPKMRMGFYVATLQVKSFSFADVARGVLKPNILHLKGL